MTDSILTWFLLSMFALLIASGFVQYHATSKLAKWLYLNHPDVWRELGRPGTSSFRGDPDNRKLARISALQSMQRMMPLHAYRSYLANEEADRYLRQHRLGGILSVIFMALFFGGIFYGIFLVDLATLHKAE
jgi:hypothetical protein